MQIATIAGLQLPAFCKATRQFFSIIPVLIGVILLVGLSCGFVSRGRLLTIFSGNVIQNTLWGACIGSVLSGTPATSYVIGETGLKMGVSLFGGVAMMLTWINVRLTQLPTEISTLEARFAISRTIVSILDSYRP
jgi:hypothetical protein